MCNNFEIIERVKQIVGPYFEFNMEDFYGDKGSCVYPEIEEINVLYFKLNGKGRNLVLTKNDQQKMIDDIKNLNIGKVEFLRVQSIGQFIAIEKHINI